MGFEVTRDGKATCQEADGTKDLHHVSPLALAVLRFRFFDSVLRPLGFARDRILSNVEGFDSPKIGASASATLRRTGAQDFAQDDERFEDLSSPGIPG